METVSSVEGELVGTVVGVSVVDVVIVVDGVDVVTVVVVLSETLEGT